MAEAEARAMAEAETEARAINEAADAAAAPRAVAPELVSRLLSAIAVLAAPPSGPAVAEANQWLMELMQAPECWPCALAALQSTPSDSVVHGLLSLCLSLVRQARLSDAPPPSALAPLVRQLWLGTTEVTATRRQACTLLCALACVDGHECDRLLDWALGLGAQDGALHLLALHLLQVRVQPQRALRWRRIPLAA